MLHLRYGRLIIGVTLFVLALLASMIALTKFDQRRTDAEMGAVLSALFSNHFLHDGDANREIQIILLREAPNAWKRDDFRGSLLFNRRLSFSQSSSSTRYSFILSNVLPTNIKAELVLPNRAQFFLISRKELEELFSQNDFQTRYPNNWGHFVISHIGLNPNKTEAILYVDHFAGGLSSGGSYFLMRKLNGVWNLVDQHLVWNS